jgi:hypothetical protein
LDKYGTVILGFISLDLIAGDVGKAEIEGIFIVV